MSDYTYKGKERHLLDILRSPKLNKGQARKNALFKKVTAGTGRMLTKKEQEFKSKHYLK